MTSQTAFIARRGKIGHWRGLLPRWPATALLLGLASPLAASMWGRSGELLLDFGRECDVFWLMSSGKALYRDLEYRFGPLAPLAYSGLFGVFGPDLRVLLAANLLVALLAIALMHRLLLRLTRPPAAFVATLFFIAVFVFSTLEGVAQYNYLTPYNHDAVWGFTAALGAMLCLSKFLRAPRWTPAIGIGALSGACFLCKPEVFVALALGLLAAGVGLLLARQSLRWRLLAGIVGGITLSLVAAVVALRSTMPWPSAIESLTGAWRDLARPEIFDNPFYRKCLGIDEPLANVLRMLGSALAVALLLGVARHFGRKSRRGEAVRRNVAVAAVAGLFLADAACENWITRHLDRGLPLEIAALGILIVRRILWPTATDRQDRPANVARFAFAAFALGLLLKILLYTRSIHYGFLLTAPAAMLGIIALLDDLPAWLERSGRSGAVLRAAALTLLASIVIYRQAITWVRLRDRTATVQLAMGGALRLGTADAAVPPVVARMAESPGVGHSTLVVFPDASGLAFAAGLPSSIRYTQFNPLEIQLTGQPRMIEALDANPPDLIAIVQSDESEFGAERFGRDFGRDLAAWINRRYVMDYYVGGGPGGEKVRRIFVLKRRNAGAG